MTSQMVTDKWELYNHAPFILHAVEEVAKAAKEDVDPTKYFNFLVSGLHNGNVGVVLQTINSKPVAICVMVIRHNDLGTEFVEITLVHNTPEANPKLALESVCIPWAKKMGAKFLTTYNPVIEEKEPIYDRRLTKYGFHKVATLFERMI